MKIARNLGFCEYFKGSCGCVLAAFPIPLLDHSLVLHGKEFGVPYRGLHVNDVHLGPPHPSISPMRNHVARREQLEPSIANATFIFASYGNEISRPPRFPVLGYTIPLTLRRGN